MEGLLVCVIGTPLNGRFVCEGEQMGVKRTRNEERIHIVWTTSFFFHSFFIVSFYFFIVC